MKENAKYPVEVTNETELANFVDESGRPVITHWYEPDAKFYSADTLLVRNRAAKSIWTRSIFTKSGRTYRHDFAKHNAQPVVHVGLTAVDTPIDLDEYTVFSVLKAADDFVETGIAAAYGAAEANDSYNNTPNLSYTYISGGEWRIHGKHTNKDLQLSYAMLPEDAKKFHLYAITRSQGRGLTLRVDGIEVASTNSASAKSKVTSKKMRLLGFDFESGAWQGSVGNIVICKKDLSLDDYALQAFENYFMSKYDITAP
ncbi:hypothetical protein ACS8E3_07595 [Psychrobacter sp. 2Y5]|uniref:hypothetical protein n=1 Tax=unclassified Psychrobacter TaxID=196806 RepID=UPI003F46FDD6